VPTSIYLAAVLAYPTGWPARGLGALIGVLAINFINVFRVVALFLIGLYLPTMFHETHVYVAQALLICVAVAAWMYWVSRFADAPAV
jgi:exosortase/archaeosortase family protein